MISKDIPLTIFTLLTVIGYFTINILIPIPEFIKYENYLYILLYILTYIVSRRGNYIPITALIFFNIGRLSRSIITSHGEIADLALQHLPLLIYLFLFGIYTSYKTLTFRNSRLV